VTTFHFDIGLSLRTAQKKFRVSNKQLAQDFGVTDITIGRWRKSKDASLGRIVDFAERFDMDFDTFLDLPYKEEE
jgi:transcriptional regulator with XRE-family HTH domain